MEKSGFSLFERPTTGPLSILALALFAVVTVACASPYAHLLTTQQPSAADLVGVYVYRLHSLPDLDFKRLPGGPPRLELRADGTFAARNLPRNGFASTTFTSVASPIGRWTIQTTGSVETWRGLKEVWGIGFGGLDVLDPVSLSGDAPPYGIIAQFDDPDLGYVLMLRRER